MTDIDTKQIARDLECAFKTFRKAKFTSMVNSECFIKKSHTHVLLNIDELGIGITATELAKKMDVTMGAITHHIQELEELELVERIQDKKDKRVSLISLSEKGKKVLSHFENTHLKHMEQIVDYLGESDSQKLVEIVTKLSKFEKKD